MIDRNVTRKWWGQRALMAGDPRSVTLDKESAWWVGVNVRLYQRWLFRNLDEMGARPRLAVDLGCGNGDWTLVLAGKVERLVAVDFTQGFLDAVEQRIAGAWLSQSVSFVLSDAAAFEFPAGCELIVLGAVVQYLDDDEVASVLERARGALAPGGLVYLRTTVSRSTETIRRASDEYHAIYRPTSWVESCCERAGLEIVRRTTGTNVIGDELMRKLFGRWLGPVLAAPVRLGRRIARRRMETDNVHFLAREKDRS